MKIHQTRLQLLDEMIHTPGPSSRPGVWVAGLWRCDREAKRLWLQERQWRGINRRIKRAA